MRDQTISKPLAYSGWVFSPEWYEAQEAARPDVPAGEVFSKSGNSHAAPKDLGYVHRPGYYGRLKPTKAQIMDGVPASDNHVHSRKTQFAEVTRRYDCGALVVRRYNTDIMAYLPGVGVYCTLNGWHTISARAAAMRVLDDFVSACVWGGKDRVPGARSVVWLPHVPGRPEICVADAFIVFFGKGRPLVGDLSPDWAKQLSDFEARWARMVRPNEYKCPGNPDAVSDGFGRRY